LQSQILKNMALQNISTGIFSEILAEKSFGLPFLQKFWLCRKPDCLFQGKFGFANPAPACIFFPGAIRMTVKPEPRSTDKTVF